MSGNPLRCRKTLLTMPALVIAASTAMLSLPALTPAANAATGDAVTVTTADKTQSTQGSSATITGTATIGTGEALDYKVVSGPDATAGSNADGTITTTSGNWSVTIHNTSGNPGTDVVHFWIDQNADNVQQGTEPSDTASVDFIGAPYSVNLSPSSEGASVGSCAAYTVSSADSKGQNNLSAPITITATQTLATGHANLTQCNPTTGAVIGSSSADSITFTTTTGADGTAASFGIESDSQGTVDLRAFYDANDSGAYNTGEPTDTATLTVSANGADAAKSLTPDHTSQSVLPGDTVTTKVTVTNAAGDTLSGVTVNEATTGANPGTSTAVSDAHGVATFTYTATHSGTDTLKFWVNQSTGGTAGPDSGEPQASETVTVAAATTATSLDVTCTTHTQQIPGHNCYLPLDQPTDTIVASVTAPDGTDPGTAPDPVSGVTVQIAVTGVDSSDAAASRITQSATSCTTGADGTCSITVTDTGAKDGDYATIVARAPGTSGTLTATSHIHWVARRVSNVDIEPSDLTKHVGGTATLTATVTDEFGAPVANTQVQATVSGRNSKTLTGTTNGSGVFTISYTDTGDPTVASNDTVSVQADTDPTTTGLQGDVTNSATVHWILGSDVATKIQLAENDYTPDFNNPTAYKTSTQDNVYYSTDEESEYCYFAATYCVDIAEPEANEDEITVLVGNADGTPLSGAPVTVTTSMPGIDGENTSWDSSEDFPVISQLDSTEHLVTNSSGEVSFWVWSPKVGTQTITVTSAAGASDTGTETWTNEVWDARDVTLVGNQSPKVGGENLAAVVTDRFDNGVGNVDLAFSSTGVGALGNGNGTTNSAGVTTVPIVSSSKGTQEVTATIKSAQSTISGYTLTYYGDPWPADTQCGLGEGDPDSNDPAGACSDTLPVNWGAVTPPTQTIEKPTLKVHVHKHHVHLKAIGHPKLKHKTMHFYIVKHGIQHLIASHSTRDTGTASVTVHLKKGHYTIDCRIVRAGGNVVSKFSSRHHVHVK